MSTIPIPMSFNAILGGNIQGTLSRIGIPSLKVGSPCLSLLEAVSQSQLKVSASIFSFLASVSLDQATGVALDRTGLSENLPRIPVTPATNIVTITDTSFVKISTKIFQGGSAPIIGTLNLNVTDATNFPATDSVYLGRGTNDYEGPLAYTSLLAPTGGPLPVNAAGYSGGSYWTIVLSSGTQRFHNIGETVILAQGGLRSVPSGSVVQTPQGNLVQSVQFKTLFDVNVPDGETTIFNVNVRALKAGSVGNIQANAINQFAQPPFTGAKASNPLPFTNGLPAEDDDSYRERIRLARQSRVKGTVLALQTASVGVVDPTQNKRVISASVLSMANQPTILIIDDGTGYEETTQGVAIESLFDSALGGESFCKTTERPIAKAFVLSTDVAPFNLTSGATLAVEVGGITTEHSFNGDEFQAINNATAYEVIASVNGNPLLNWSARTVNNGSQVAIFAKADTNEDLQVLSVAENDANTAFGFPTTHTYTMRLYRNDLLLNKDGQLAFLNSNPISQWAPLSGPQTLVIVIDGIPFQFGTVGGFSYPQFAAFTDQDFVNNNTGYTSLGINNEAAWATVLNARIPGITATVNAGLITITSNKGRTKTAQIQLLGGTLVTNGMFALGASLGAPSDYLLDRNTGEIRLQKQLLAGDTLAAGSVNTRAFLQSDAFTTLTLASNARLWFAVDDNAQLVNSGVNASTALTITVPQPISGRAYVSAWGITARVASVTGSPLFLNIEPDDWAIFTDPSFGALQGALRVAKVDAGGTYFDIELKTGAVGRENHQTTVLGSGKLLITGGFVGLGTLSAISSVELYNPATGVYTAVPPMSIDRVHHRAALLPSGKVLVTGGFSTSTNAFLASAEIYDPVANTWSPTTNMSIPRSGHGLIQLNNTTILAFGGQTAATAAPSDYVATAEFFTEGGATWTATGSMATARANFASTIFAGTGNVVVAGGWNFTTVLNTAEKYAAGSWTSAGTMSVARHHAASTKATATTFWVMGGDTSLSSPTASTAVDIYTDGSGWAAGTSLPVAQFYCTAATAGDGSIVLVTSSGEVSGALYSTGGAWTPTSAMLSADPSATIGRQNATAVAEGGAIWVIGGINKTTDLLFSAIESYTGSTSNIWSVVQPDLTTVSGGIFLVSNGLQFARTPGRLSKVTIPSGTNYTSSSLVPLLTIPGATSSVYKTNSYRFRTNTFNDSAGSIVGDIAFVGADASGLSLKLTPADATVNLTGHLASVESGNSELGTPWFGDPLVLGTEQDEQHLLIENWTGNSSDFVVGSKAITLGSTWGQVQGFVSQLVAGPVNGVFNLRAAPEQGWLPYSHVWAASPYATGPNDTLNVLVDQDIESLRFNINLFRNLKTVGTTYGATNAFLDADNGNQSLAVGFGYTGGPQSPFNFNDFAVYMSARTIMNSGDSTHSVLWRYKRLGPDGNRATVQYTYPAAPNMALSVVANDTGSNAATQIDIVLAGGALRTGYTLSPTGLIGQAPTTVSNGIVTGIFLFGFKVLHGSRDGSGNVTLIMEMPPGINHTGWSSGSGAFNFVSSSAIPSAGAFTLTANPTSSGGGIYDTITYNDGSSSLIGSIANPGIVYITANQTGSLVGSNIAQFDFINIQTSASADPNFEGMTGRIVSDPVAHPYWLQVVYDDPTFGESPTDTLSYTTLGSVPTFQVWANTAQTVTQIVTAVNALANSPITGKVLGSGSGTINESTDESAGASNSGLALTDGINYVSVTTVPSAIGNNYSFTFKDPISASLATGSDWADETVVIGPKTAQNMVDWLTAPAVSGLFSCAEVSLSSQAHRVQIASKTAGSNGSVQVQGGTGNAATASVVGSSIGLTGLNQMVSSVRAADVTGFYAGQWCSVDNAVLLPKISQFASGSILKSVTLFGNIAQWLFSSAPAYTNQTRFYGAQVEIQRQGNFVCIIDTASPSASLNLTSITEGQYVWLTTNSQSGPNYSVNPLNLGLFKVVRKFSPSIIGTAIRDRFWIENANAVEQDAILDVVFMDASSTAVGDTLAVSTPIWPNNGNWSVTSVGAQRVNIAANQITTASTTATVVTAVPHNFSMGDRFSLSPGSSQVNASTTYYVSNVVSATSFQFTFVGAGGTVPSPQIAVGFPYQNANLIETDNSAQNTGIVSTPPPALGAQSPLVQFIEGTLDRYIKQIYTIVGNSANPALTDVKFNTSFGFGNIGSAGGSVITILDKLDFSTTIKEGLDGYTYDTGLIQEVNRVIYGDPSDTVAYPGVAAAGADVNIQGPLVRRIQVSLAIRTKSGVVAQYIEEAIQSAVAGIVNDLGVGQSVALSDLIDAAASVAGVISVVMVSPALTTSTDLIVIQSNEVAKVLNVQDVSVTFIG